MRTLPFLERMIDFRIARPMHVCFKVAPIRSVSMPYALLLLLVLRLLVIPMATIYSSTAIAASDEIEQELSKLVGVRAIIGGVMSRKMDYNQQLSMKESQEDNQNITTVTKSEIEKFILDSVKRGVPLDFKKEFGTNFVEMDFSGMRLKGAIFDGVDLRRANFKDAGLINSKFYNCKIDGAIFSEGTITQTEFADCSMQKVEFMGTDIDGVSISRSNLDLMHWLNVFVKNLVVTDSHGAFNLVNDSHINNAAFVNSQLKYMIFENSKIVNATFDNTDMPFVSLIGTSIGSSKFFSSNMKSAIFYASTIKNTIINNNELDGSYISASEAVNMTMTHNSASKMHLVYTNVANSNWSHSDFNNSVIENSGFSSVNFSWSNLLKSQVNTVEFSGCVLRGTIAASLSGSKISFIESWLNDMDLSVSSLPGLVIKKSTIYDASLDLMDAYSSYMYDTEVVNSTFLGTRLSGSKFKKVTIKGGMLSYVDFSDSWFSRSNIANHPILNDVDMSRTLFYKSTFNDVALDQAIMLGASFIKTDMTSVSFNYNKLGGMVFLESTFDPKLSKTLSTSGAVMSKEDLSAQLKQFPVSYKGITFVDVDLSNIDLRGIDLSDSYLLFVNFKSSDLTGANLKNAVIQNVDFTDARR